ncbi:MAG: AraC family transcriptional regulator [Candidatus Enteromonas sp.]|nr:AraC family transcriptional regulator [Candidatus Enteromonas sp.]
MFNKSMICYGQNDIQDNPYTRLNYHSGCMPTHRHDFFEAVLVESGTCLNTINDEPTLVLQTMDLLLLRTNDYHESQFGSKSSRWRDYYISQDLFQKACDFLSPGLMEHFMSLSAPPRCTLSLEEFNVLKAKTALLEQLQLEKNSDKIQSVFAGIVIFLLQSLSEKNIAIKNQAPDWLTRLYKKMTYYDFVHMDLREIIETTGYSNAYVTTMFRKYYGMTLIQYHNKMKVIYSTSLLGKERILDIAYSLGWDNPKNYSIAFQKVYSITPKKYEKLIMSSKKK